MSHTREFATATAVIETLGPLPRKSERAKAVRRGQASTRIESKR
jgi:hypothetical protein